MRATETVADESPRHGVDAITKRKQDGEEDHWPEPPVAVRQHEEAQSTQKYTHGADPLFRLPVTEPSRQRPHDDGAQRRQAHEDRRRRLVQSLPDQQRHEVDGDSTVGNIAQAVEGGEQPEDRRP